MAIHLWGNVPLASVGVGWHPTCVRRGPEVRLSLGTSSFAGRATSTFTTSAPPLSATPTRFEHVPSAARVAARAPGEPLQERIRSRALLCCGGVRVNSPTADNNERANNSPAHEGWYKRPKLFTPAHLVSTTLPRALLSARANTSALRAGRPGRVQGRGHLRDRGGSLHRVAQEHGPGRPGAVKRR